MTILIHLKYPNAETVSRKLKSSPRFSPREIAPHFTAKIWKNMEPKNEGTLYCKAPAH